MPTQDPPVLDSTFENKLNALISAVTPNVPGFVSDAYDPTDTYAVGDYAIYENILYKCTTAISTPEAWDSAHWTPTNCANEFSSLKSSLSANKLSTPTSLTQTNYDYVMTSDGYIKMEGGLHAGGGPVIRVFGSDKGTTYMRLYKITDVQTYGDSLCFFVRKGMIIVVEQFANGEGTVTYYPLTN